MENLCISCMINCLDRQVYKKKGIRITDCQFYTVKLHAFQQGECHKCSEPRLTNAILDNKAVEFDTCFGYLPGVRSACCGHGEEGHILFNNGTMVRFKDVKIIPNYPERCREEE